MVIQKYPKRHDKNGFMYLSGTGNPLTASMCDKIHAALLNTSVVREMNNVLAMHGLGITKVETEEMYIASEKGQFRWDAIGWLIIGKPNQAMQAAGAVAPRPDR